MRQRERVVRLRRLVVGVRMMVMMVALGTPRRRRRQGPWRSVLGSIAVRRPGGGLRDAGGRAGVVMGVHGLRSPSASGRWGRAVVPAVAGHIRNQGRKERKIRWAA